MLSEAPASAVEIWPTMFGTLLLAMQMRAVFGARGSTASGKFTLLLDVAVLEEVLDGVGHHHRAVLLGFVGRGAEMRQRHDLRVILERVGREVADVALQAAVVERRDDRLLVDDRRAREVQDDAVLAHELEARCVHEAARLGRQRHVHGDDVRAREQVVERQRLLARSTTAARRAAR